MFEVSVEESFAAGHALRGYRGKCENPHGHNYKVRITLAGDDLDSIGLLWDFKDLKAARQREQHTTRGQPRHDEIQGPPRARIAQHDRAHVHAPAIPAGIDPTRHTSHRAMAFTISGPSTPATDHAVSSRPWMAPT